MPDYLKAINSVVANLEATQSEIGEAQVELLNILTDERHDEWDGPAQAGLLKLEIVQRTIGETQFLLVEAIPICPPDAKVSGAPEVIGSARETPGVPFPEPTPSTENEEEGFSAESKNESSTTPPRWLERRDIKIKKIAPPSGLDGSADRAALLLGERFSTIGQFYQAVRRRVIGQSTKKWFDTPDLPRETVKDICDFGNRLKASGFFTEFRYFSRGHSRDPQHTPTLLFDPLSDSRVRYFFVGGWLERYVFQVVKQHVQQSTGSWCDEQFVKGVEVEFSDGGKGEFDVLVALPGDRMLWLECKTGKWQDYIRRFQSINRKFLKIPSEHSALVLVQKLDTAEKSSASELTGMTVIHFSELSDWLTRVMSTSNRKGSYTHDLRIDKLTS